MTQEPLLLFPTLSGEFPWRWSLSSQQGTAQSMQDLAMLNQYGHPLVLVLNNKLVSFLEIKLQGSPRERARSLPFVIEDYLSCPKEAVKIACGKNPLLNGKYSVRVVSYEILSLLFKRCAQANLIIKGVFAEADLFSYHPKAWSFILTPEKAWLYAEEQILIIPPSNPTHLPNILKIALNRARECPTEIMLYADQQLLKNINLPSWVHSLKTETPIGDNDFVITTLSMTLLTTKKNTLLNSALNLIPEAYRQHPWQTLLRRWLPVITMIGLSWVVYLFGLFAQIIQTQLAISKAENNLTVLAKEALPNTPIVEPATQMNEVLRRLAVLNGKHSETDFIPMVSKISQALAPNSSLTGIKYSKGLIYLEIPASQHQATIKKLNQYGFFAQTDKTGLISIKTLFSL